MQLWTENAEINQMHIQNLWIRYLSRVSQMWNVNACFLPLGWTKESTIRLALTYYSSENMERDSDGNIQIQIQGRSENTSRIIYTTIMLETDRRDVSLESNISKQIFIAWCSLFSHKCLHNSFACAIAGDAGWYYAYMHCHEWWHQLEFFI